MEALKELLFCFAFGYGNQHGRILTSNDFMRKEIPMAEWCCVCKCNGEIMDHFLLHSGVAHNL